MPANDSGTECGRGSTIGGQEVLFPTIAASAVCAVSRAPSIEAGRIREPGSANPPRKHDLNCMGAPRGGCQKFTVEFF